MNREDGGLPGQWLREQREDAGLSQEELANRSGLSVRTVSSLERGSIRTPHPRTIRLLGEPLGLPAKACLLSGRRVLIILDNACGPGQVRPLLPAAPGCVTLVTSRDTLAGLVARDGAQRLDLDLLPMTDAVGLLRALIGSRVDAAPGAAAELAARCSRLPLALRVAAEIATAYPAGSLADLVGELEDQQQRLDVLDPVRRPALAGALVRASQIWGVSLACNKGLAGAPATALQRTADTSMNPAVLDSFALAITTANEPRLIPASPGTSRMSRWDGRRRGP